MKSLADKLQKNKLSTKEELKSHIFDWIAAIIVVSLIAASLDIFGLIDFKKVNIVEFLISWFPYLAAAILLRNDLYKKGVFVGKNTEKFSAVIRDYSQMANSLTGEQIKGLHPFCEKYNDDVRRELQTAILRNEGLYFKDFDEEWISIVDGKQVKNKPLKVLEKKELIALKFTKRQIKAIKHARNVKVRGISVNILLSNTKVSDSTYIGRDESSLRVAHMAFSVGTYVIVTFVLSFLAIKNITEWGWVGLILTLFKVLYLFAGSYMSYFKGYDDATINLVSYFTRKTDIIKMYLNYVPEVREEIVYETVEQ